MFVTLIYFLSLIWQNIRYFSKIASEALVMEDIEGTHQQFALALEADYLSEALELTGKELNKEECTTPQ